MGLILNILVVKGKIRPLARNLLRAVALQADCDLIVRCTDKEEISISGREPEPFPATQSLMEALAFLDPDAPLEEPLKTQLRELLSWLKEHTGGRETTFEFPPENIWEEVHRQSVFYTAAESETEFRSFWRKWREKYPHPQEFQVTGKSVVNEINRQEAGDYLDAHKASENVSYIENAGKSLLAVIPNDVESILDVGSGPGYMDRCIPSDYAVLAMDIDEKILAGNPRPTCVGDIRDIPLPDQSVDFVMASDMLEHLPEDVLRAGMKEMERVSRKYLYLQVPFMEDPLMAFAHCPKCGHVWHVNHHKRFFDQERLCSLLSKEWQPTVVNFTGDVSFRRNGFLETKLAETVGWQICMVENAICPECGGESACIGNEYREKLRNLVNSDKECPFPAYTEIGILFCRAGQAAELPEVASASFLGRRARNAALLGNDAKVEKNYDSQRLLPTIHTMGCRMETSLETCWFYRADEASQAWCGIFFPALSARHTEVEIGGILSSEGTVRLVLGGEGEERAIAEWRWERKKGSYVCRLPEEVQGKPLYLKLYFSEAALGLFHCELLGEQAICHEWYAEKDASFLCFEDENVQYRLLMACSGRMLLSHWPKEWLRLTNGISARMQRVLQRLLADGGQRRADKRRLIEDDAWRQSLADGGQKRDDNRRLMEEAAWRQALVDGGQMRDDNRHFIEDFMLMEYSIDIYGGAEKRGWRGAVFTGLDRFAQKSNRWLRSHDRIHDFLVSCGVKNFYMKIKRRLEK